MFETANNKKMTIFVTGGTGRLGRALITELLKRGHVVRAMAESHELLVKYMPSGVVPFVGDLNNTKLLKEACRGADVVVHLAAIVSEYKESTGKLMQVNVDGTANVLEAAALGKVEQFIYASTVDVYGKSRREILTEETEPKPTDKYGYSKMLAEQEVERYRGRLHYTIFRMAAIYGPGFEASYFRILRAIKNGRAAVIGSGENRYAFVHVRDVVNAYLLAIGNQESYDKVFNITDGSSYTQKQIFEMAARQLGVNPPQRSVSHLVLGLVAKSRGIDNDELRFLTSSRMVEIKKAQKELGYKPSVKIESGVKELVEAFQRQDQKPVQ